MPESPNPLHIVSTVAHLVQHCDVKHLGISPMKLELHTGSYISNEPGLNFSEVVQNKKHINSRVVQYANVNKTQFYPGIIIHLVWTIHIWSAHRRYRLYLMLTCLLWPIVNGFHWEKSLILQHIRCILISKPLSMWQMGLHFPPLHLFSIT